MADKLEKGPFAGPGKHNEYSGNPGRSSKRVSIDFEVQRNLKTVEAGLAPEEVAVVIDVDPKEEARILKKIDFRLVPLLAMLYLYVCPIHGDRND